MTIGCWAASDAERAAKAGELVTLKGQRLLRLFGPSLKERGFAHGYLLAEDICGLAAYLKDLPNFGAERYNRSLVPWSTKSVVWDADAQTELEGIFEGMAARLGKNGLRCDVLTRDWTLDDLKAINAIADYFGPGCSAVAVWGPRSADGAVLHARTLDFPLCAQAVASQVMVAMAPLEAGDGWPRRAGWVSVGWPGLIAQFGGMSDTGLVACIHDADNYRAGRGEARYAPRGLVLRRILENVNPAAGDPSVAAAAMCAESSHACGNMIHLSWPSAVARQQGVAPSAVLEMDPAGREAQIRRPDADSLVLTNHFLVLNKPIECARFKAIQSGLDLLAQAHKPVGLLEARKLLMSAEQTVAAHSLYFRPDTLELSIALSHNNVMSPHVVPTAFTLKELFGK